MNEFSNDLYPSFITNCITIIAKIYDKNNLLGNSYNAHKLKRDFIKTITKNKDTKKQWGGGLLVSK